VISGESGAVGVGLLELLAKRPEFAKLRERMGLDAESVVLLFSTEGDTDPASYEAIVHGQQN
jgi:diaminopropionate ammonia-lyase